MPRTARVAPGGVAFHVLYRGVGKNKLFLNDQDFLAFERIIADTLDKRPMRILSDCLLPNHWHFVLWPEHDGNLGRFMQRLTVTHVTRWQNSDNMVGHGHVYQSRFKSFPVETDAKFYQVNRYVERNALRANLVNRAEQWPYGSLWIRGHGTAEHRKLLSQWPLRRRRKWLNYVNEPVGDAELAALRRSVVRGTPDGSTAWSNRQPENSDWKQHLASRGRPKKR